MEEHKFSPALERGLEALGFWKNEKGEYVYASGSVSNYTKMRVCPPRLMTSVRTEKEILACYTEFESFQEPGYIECDWKYTAKGAIDAEPIHLLHYCASKTAQNVEKAYLAAFKH